MEDRESTRYSQRWMFWVLLLSIAREARPQSSCGTNVVPRQPVNFKQTPLPNFRWNLTWSPPPCTTDTPQTWIVRARVASETNEFIDCYQITIPGSSNWVVIDKDTNWQGTAQDYVGTTGAGCRHSVPTGPWSTKISSLNTWPHYRQSGYLFSLKVGAWLYSSPTSVRLPIVTCSPSKLANGCISTYNPTMNTGTIQWNSETRVYYTPVQPQALRSCSVREFRKFAVPCAPSSCYNYICSPSAPGGSGDTLDPGLCHTNFLTLQLTFGHQLQVWGFDVSTVQLLLA